MNPEPKTTIEELMEECLKLNQGYAGVSNYLRLTTEGDGIYEVNVYGRTAEHDTTPIGALTKLKAALEPHAKKEAAEALARAEAELVAAQAKVEKLTTLRNNLNP